MSERPSWLRADLLVFAAVAVVFAVAALSPRWRMAAAGAVHIAGTAKDVPASTSSSRRRTLDQQNLPPGEIDPSKLKRHRSPFDDAVTARAETLCVHMTESQLGYALKEPVTVEVHSRYGTGSEDDGRGVYLIFEGLATTPSSRVSVFRCTAKSYGALPGEPVITHMEGP